MAGITKIVIKCTPTANPIIKEIRIIQRSERSESSFSHFRISQNNRADIIEPIPYTSPSTAENQKESEKAKAKAPTIPLPNMAICCESVNSDLSSSCNNRCAKCVILQNKNNIAKALAVADIKLISIGIRVGSPKDKVDKAAPSNWKKAAPGACPTSKLAEMAMYSPQSQ